MRYVWLVVASRVAEGDAPTTVKPSFSRSCEMGEAPRSHQPRGFRYGKRIPGYSHPRNHL